MSAFKPCGHSALGCYNDGAACCKACDHPTYWRELDAERTQRGGRLIESTVAPALEGGAR